MSRGPVIPLFVRRFFSKKRSADSVPAEGAPSGGDVGTVSTPGNIGNPVLGIPSDLEVDASRVKKLKNPRIGDSGGPSGRPLPTAAAEAVGGPGSILKDLPFSSRGPEFQKFLGVTSIQRELLEGIADGPGGGPIPSPGEERRALSLAREMFAIRERAANVEVRAERIERANSLIEASGTGRKLFETPEQKSLKRQRTRDILRKRANARRRRNLGLPVDDEEVRRIPSLREVRRERDASQVTEDETGGTRVIAVPLGEVNRDLLKDGEVFRVLEETGSRFVRYDKEIDDFTDMVWDHRGGPRGDGAFAVDPSVPEILSPEAAEEFMSTTAAFYSALSGQPISDASYADLLRKKVALIKAIQNDPVLPLEMKVKEIDRVSKALDRVEIEEPPPEGIMEAIDRLVHVDPEGRTYVLDPNTGVLKHTAPSKKEKEEPPPPASVQEMLVADPKVLDNALKLASEILKDRAVISANKRKAAETDLVKRGFISVEPVDIGDAMELADEILQQQFDRIFGAKEEEFVGPPFPEGAVDDTEEELPVDGEAGITLEEAERTHVTKHLDPRTGEIFFVLPDGSTVVSSPVK